MINNISEITCFLSGTQIILNSNNVSINLINPIILFEQYISVNKVIINISNNSGIKLYNLIFFDNSNGFISGSVTVNGIEFNNLNPLNGIYLGNLENLISIEITYLINNYNKVNTYLYYENMINNQRSKFILKSN